MNIDLGVKIGFRVFALYLPNLAFCVGFVTAMRFKTLYMLCVVFFEESAFEPGL